MKLLLQSNLWNEYGYTRLIASIQNAGIDYQEVNVIPFTTDFVDPVDFMPHACFGSTRFIDVCRAKGFPTFKSFAPIEDFLYPWPDWVNGVPNSVETVITFAALKATKFPCKPFFVKPFTEKFFTGLVIESAADLERIQTGNSFLEDEDKELVRITPAVNISQEVRFFIVNNTIITASAYKVKGQPKHFAIDSSHPAWYRCQTILNCYGSIDKAFVMDLGQVGYDDWQIVELNNFNSSGLYESDTDALTNAIKHL